MFEDALVESSGRLSGKLTANASYLRALSIALNAFILAALILWPLLHPLSLPKQALAILLTAPPPPVPVAAKVKTAAATSTKARLEIKTVDISMPTRIRQLSRAIAESIGEPPDQVTGAIGDLNASSFSDIVGNGTAASHPAVRPALPAVVHLSTGVVAGNKLSGADPVYPAIARAAHIGGAVVLQATIAKSGFIENLRVVSGPPLLASSAIDAVKTWRYRPYLLNGEPVEVETTVNVVFNLQP